MTSQVQPLSINQLVMFQSALCVSPDVPGVTASVAMYLISPCSCPLSCDLCTLTMPNTVLFLCSWFSELNSAYIVNVIKLVSDVDIFC